MKGSIGIMTVACACVPRVVGIDFSNPESNFHTSFAPKHV